MRRAPFVGLLLSVIIVSAKPSYMWNNDDISKSDTSESKCGYNSCFKSDPNKLNIHIVPHTHDDVGWLKTVDQYYYGSQTLKQKAGVQYILDSVVGELLKDSNRRFIYVESAFFFKWWYEQSSELQNNVKKLVNEGRLQFAGGAWSMNDEATTHYQSLIDQFSHGLRLLNETFGECGRPKIAWQIDSFGHSREMASILAQMNFEGLFFARLDYEDKSNRLKNQEAEFIWHTSESLEENNTLFTGILYNHYSPPPGFCYDILCADEPIIDGKHSHDNNVKNRTAEFVKYVKKMSKYYKTNNLMVPMGDDFNYQAANMWYKNLDKLIKHTNELYGDEVNLFYSTPLCYLKSLKEHNVVWPIKNLDFFPYSSDPHTFWSGYFTSRPTLKRFERIGNHFLQVCKQLTIKSWMDHLGDHPIDWRKYEHNLNEMREAMGIMQHHDAITGTEKQLVAYDYARQLYEAIESCAENTRYSLNAMHKIGTNLPDFQFDLCLNLNISQCAITENSSKFIVTVFNPLGHDQSDFVRVPIPNNECIVRDASGKQIQTQTAPIPDPVKALSYRNSVSKNELVFFADSIKHSGYESYYISCEQNHISSEWTDRVPEVILMRQQRYTEQGDFEISNENIKLKFHNGLLSSIEQDNLNINVGQQFYYYKAATGNNLEFKNRSSGAYIFRPNGSEIAVSEFATVKVIRGELVTEVHQIFNDWISQVVRLYRGEKFVEFEWLVGPIPVEDNIGKEIITRFTSNIASNGIFYTDSNGRETMRRVRNKRESFEPTLEEKVAGNYYPVTSKIVIADKNVRLALMTDRSQGGSSIYDGSVELMLHRRLLFDDAFGVGEALNEEAFGKGLVTRGKYYLMISNPIDINTQTRERFLELKKSLPFWSFFSDATHLEYDEWHSKFRNSDNIPVFEIPENLHLLTAEPFNDRTLLLRFENYAEKTNKTVSINIKNNFQINNDWYKTIFTTLDGNEEIQKNMSDYRFGNDEFWEFLKGPSVARWKELKPMEILTLQFIF